MSSKLLLFDIDGTLLDSGGAGLRSLELAFRDAFSVDNAAEGISMAGRTDVGIILDMMGNAGVPPLESSLQKVLDCYLGHLIEQIASSRKRLMPGVSCLLEELVRTEGLSLGLLTGNVEDGAHLKLKSLGIEQYFATAEGSLVGAFGSDNADRNELLPIAVERCREAFYVELSYGDCIVVGDTPMDIGCAKPYGATAIGVATGPYEAEELKRAGADEVFEDLSDVSGFMEFAAPGVQWAR